MPDLRLVILLLLLIPVRLAIADEVTDRVSSETGRLSYFEYACFRCHAEYPPKREPVLSRFRAAHDPTARDYLQNGLHSRLLNWYKEALTDPVIIDMVDWSQSARTAIKRRGPMR